MNDPLDRHPTQAARRALATRFDLPFDEVMQDWEWEVARPDMVDPFLRAYRSGELDEDERFSLMEMLVQAVAEAADDQGHLPPEWDEIATLLEAAPELHAKTASYWTCFAGGVQWSAVGVEMRRRVLPEIQRLLGA